MSVTPKPVDSAVVPVGQRVPDPAHQKWILVCTILASSLSFVDGSVINVALPAIARSLSADAGALQWIVNSYLLPLSALLLLGGAAGDHFGRRRLLITGTTLFGLASLACALAPGLSLLLVARFFQGVGAALLLPNSLAILGQTFSGESKGRAIGTWAASAAAMAAVGPVLGGWIIDLGSWRMIFMINLPLAAAAIFLAWRCVPRDSIIRDHPLDMYGGLLATIGLGALTWALTVGTGKHGWTISAVLSAVAACGLLIYFVQVEHRRGDVAMMPLALFASKSFLGLSVYTFLLYGAMGAMLVLIPYVLITAAGYSGTAAGAALLPLPLLLTIISPIAGSLAGRMGARLPLTVGPTVVAAGFLMALRIDDKAHYWSDVFPMMVVMSLGMSAAVAPLTTAVLSSVDARYTGSASGFNSAAARTGGLVATAMLGSVLASNQLLSTFHGAMTIGALVCAAASLCAFALINDKTHAGV